MRIALVIEKLSARGGREKSTAQIAAELARRGHQVTIFCQHCDEASRAALPGVAIQELPSRCPMRCGKLIGFVRAVRRATAEGGFDVVHSMLPLPGADVYQVRGGTVPGNRQAGAMRRHGLGKVFAHVGGLFNLMRRVQARLEARAAADENMRWLTVSDLVAAEVRRFYGREKGVRTVYNAVEIPSADAAQRRAWRDQVRRRHGIGEDQLLLISVAANWPLKGMDYLLRAFAQWSPAHPQARLLLIGPADQHAKVAALAGPLAEKVTLCSETDDIFAYYSAADALVLLSWQDACSRVVLEATRWGLSSLTTALNGAAEVLAGGAGIVVATPDDLAAVVAGLERLANPAQRAAMARCCLAKADFLSLARHVDELEEVYTEVVRS